MNPESGHCVELLHEGPQLIGVGDYEGISERSNGKIDCALAIGGGGGGGVLLAIDPKKGSRFIGPDVNDSRDGIGYN